MNNTIKKLILVLAFLLFSSTASAVTIVDTGGTQSSGGVSLSDTQWIAGQFQLSDSYTIDSIEGWIWEVPGTISLAVYGDNGTLPDLTDELFRSTFTVTGIGGRQPVTSWFGSFGMNLHLNPGAYWAAFEVRSTETYSGAMPATGNATGTGLIPMSYNAARISGTWVSDSLLPNEITYGLRVKGDLQNPIPEPTTMLLLGIGLVGLAGAEVRRRRKKKQWIKARTLSPYFYTF